MGTWVLSARGCCCVTFCSFLPFSGRQSPYPENGGAWARKTLIALFSESTFY